MFHRCLKGLHHKIGMFVIGKKQVFSVLGFSIVLMVSGVGRIVAAVK